MYLIITDTLNREHTDIFTYLPRISSFSQCSSGTSIDVDSPFSFARTLTFAPIYRYTYFEDKAGMLFLHTKTPIGKRQGRLDESFYTTGSSHALRSGAPIY